MGRMAASGELSRLRKLRDQELLAADDEQELLSALMAPASTHRLVAIQALAKHERRYSVCKTADRVVQSCQGYR